MHDYENSIQYVKKALKININSAEAHNNIGNSYKKQGDANLATISFRKAIKIKPNYFEAYYNLGNTLRDLSQPEDAIKSYSAAIKINKNFFEAHTNLALSFFDLSKYEDAIKHYKEALKIRPESSATFYELGKALLKVNKIEESVKCFEKVIESDSTEVKIAAELALAHLGFKNIPLKTPKNYMKYVYLTHLHKWEKMDGWPHNNDKYLGHNMIVDALTFNLEANQNYKILDAGCGNGVLGKFLKDYASIMEGVDLSAEMLDLAREKNIYDYLYEDDLDSFLPQKKEAYDLIISAAVLVHFSNLKKILTNFYNALSYNGQLAITFFIDRTCNEFCIDSSGYFCHNPMYVNKIINKLGFSVIIEQEGVHEIRGDEKVFGAVYLLKKQSHNV